MFSSAIALYRAGVADHKDSVLRMPSQRLVHMKGYIGKDRRGGIFSWSSQQLVEEKAHSAQPERKRLDKLEKRVARSRGAEQVGIAEWAERGLSRSAVHGWKEWYCLTAGWNEGVALISRPVSQVSSWLMFGRCWVLTRVSAAC